MTIRLAFYKEVGKWYADVPQKSKEENEMVFGADEFLEKVSLGYDKIAVTFSDEECEDAMYNFKLIEHDNCGGTYKNASNENEKIWLCNVVHEVCIEHPMELSILRIEPLSNSCTSQLYKGRYCKNIAHGNIYTIIGKGLMKMEDGLWHDCVTYRGANWRLVDKPITLFTKKLSDFDKEFILL